MLFGISFTIFLHSKMYVPRSFAGGSEAKDKLELPIIDP